MRSCIEVDDYLTDKVDEDMPVVADSGVFASEVVYCGGGTTTTMLKIRSADLEALLGPSRRRIAAGR